MVDFKVIEENVTGQIVEKKSKFIANIFYVETKEEAEEILKKIKKKYYDARHNCYAYRITEGETIVERSSDDGEPSGTAGAPMLNIIAKNNISNILVIVTRYFGGILLGTGGLVKAYSDAVLEALKNAKFVEQITGYEVEVTVPYSEVENFKYFCKKEKINIVREEFLEKVKILIEIDEEKMKTQLEKISSDKLKQITTKVVQQKNIKKFL